MLPLVDAPVAPVEIDQQDPEHVHPCTASRHPHHEEKCGESAVYVIVATCSVCEPRVRYLCSPHTADYMPCYVRNGPWCDCDRHQAPHDMTSVTVRGL